MGARITAADVQVVTDTHREDGDRVIQAHVTGRYGRTFVADWNPAWSSSWLCSCGAPESCAHVRAAKEATA